MKINNNRRRHRLTVLCWFFVRLTARRHGSSVFFLSSTRYSSSSLLASFKTNRSCHAGRFGQARLLGPGRQASRSYLVWCWCVLMVWYGMARHGMAWVGGTGLGLAIVKRLCDQLNGFLFHILFAQYYNRSFLAKLVRESVCVCDRPEAFSLA